MASSAPEGEGPVVIHAWSAPRSLSTSLMYSFAQRDDMEVLDEPLYANFLRVTGVDRPYREDLLSKMIEQNGYSCIMGLFGSDPGHTALDFDPDGNKVVKEVIFGPGEKTYRYCKHISKQRLPNLSSDLMKKGKHFILIRNPLNILTFPFSFYDLLEQSLPFYNMLKRQVRRTIGSQQIPLPDPPLPVPANKKILVWVGDELLPRDSAKVSVFDSVVQGGDAVWEGLRIYDGKVFKLDEHLDRLFDSAKAMAFRNVPTRDWIKDAIFKTLIANGMFDNAHLRLTLTRGKKVTSGMSPAFNLYGCALIVLAEWKPPVYDNSHGIKLITATTRRNSPNSIDSKIHHNNLINNILAKIEGNLAQAEDAIMLDKDGFVSETNATNIFMVKKGTVLTPHADYCLPGITRATVMDLVVKENFVLHERRISLSEFHAADEVCCDCHMHAGLDNRNNG
nr:unnamed protein product [Digitaria exilis]